MKAIDIIYEDGTDKYFIIGLDDYIFFETLMKFLIQNYDAHLNNIDKKIGETIAYFNINSYSVILHHYNMLGNCLYSYEANSNRLLHMIAVDLNNRLKDIPYE